MIAGEKKIAPTQERVGEKKEIKSASDAVAGFEHQALVLERAITETEELAKTNPEKSAAQQKDLEMHAAGLWLNIRIAQASRVRLGDTPQEVGKNAERLNEIAEKLGSQPIDAYVYFLEKMLPEYSDAFGAIEEKLLKNKITALDAQREQGQLGERLSDFIERKVFLVQEMLEGRELKKMPKEEKDGLVERVQAVKKKALDMCRASDSFVQSEQEKAEKK